MKFKDSKRKWKEVYARAGIVLAAAAGLSLVLYISDNFRTIPRNENGESILKRNLQGEGSRDEALRVRTEDGGSDLTVTVEEKRYKPDELKEVFAQAGERLEELVLGENESLDEIRSDLNLADEIPGTGIQVSWELGDYNIVNILGEIQAENLTEEGEILELKAVISYGEEMAEHQFYAHVFPPKLNSSERFLQILTGKLKEQSEQEAENDYMILPAEADGKKISWSYAKDMRAAGIMFLGIVAAVLMFALEKQNSANEKKKREKQLALEYPGIVSTFTLYLGAGMPVRRAWFEMAKSYDRQKGHSYAYEEMVYTMNEIKSGAAESECYERFGNRCGITIYRKFGMLLSQNLRKGTKGMAELLKREADEAFEERKSMARKVGEETGTKLLAPMFLMLGVVLLIIVVPAFLTIQI